MWHIALHQTAVVSLAHLSKDATKAIFLFLNEVLPCQLSAQKLSSANIKMLRGIYLFPKETSHGMIHLFIHIEFEKKEIKVLHLHLRHRLEPKTTNKKK
ncbi:MAG: hypothetical protein JSS07_02315 [Proteobacteria bacterium]|nr:hypothetical protein [Pseudomonadota bacterium]